MLAGNVVNNRIVIVDYANQLHAEGTKLESSETATDAVDSPTHIVINGE